MLINWQKGKLEQIEYLVELDENLNGDLGTESTVLNHLVQSLSQTHSDRWPPVELERRHFLGSVTIFTQRNEIQRSRMNSNPTKCELGDKIRAGNAFESTRYLYGKTGIEIERGIEGTEWWRRCRSFSGLCRALALSLFLSLWTLSFGSLLSAENLGLFIPSVRSSGVYIAGTDSG